MEVRENVFGDVFYDKMILSRSAGASVWELGWQMYRGTLTLPTTHGQYVGAPESAS